MGPHNDVLHLHLEGPVQLSARTPLLLGLLCVPEVVHEDVNPSCPDKSGDLTLVRVGNGIVCNLGADGTGGEGRRTVTFGFHGS